MSYMFLVIELRLEHIYSERFHLAITVGNEMCRQWFCAHHALCKYADDVGAICDDMRYGVTYCVAVMGWHGME